MPIAFAPLFFFTLSQSKFAQNLHGVNRSGLVWSFEKEAKNEFDAAQLRLLKET